MMRTTINLPDDVGEVVRSFADSKGISLGEAVAELVRKGLRPQSGVPADSGFPQFSLPRDAAPITLERTLAVEDEV